MIYEIYEEPQWRGYQIRTKSVAQFSINKSYWRNEV